MIDLCLDEYNIDLTNSLYIGDSYSDYNLSKKFNIRFYGIKGKNNDKIFRYRDLFEIARDLEH